MIYIYIFVLKNWSVKILVLNHKVNKKQHAKKKEKKKKENKKRRSTIIKIRKYFALQATSGRRTTR